MTKINFLSNQNQKFSEAKYYCKSCTCYHSHTHTPCLINQKIFKEEDILQNLRHIYNVKRKIAYLNWKIILHHRVVMCFRILFLYCTI